MFIDVGYYGLSAKPDFNMETALRAMEDWLLHRDGYVMLYAQHRLLETGTFEKMFDFKSTYDGVAKRLNSRERFLSVQDKVRPGKL